MTKSQFLKRFVSPLPKAVLLKYPKGNITQKWAENPHLYYKFFGLKDDLSRHVCGHTGIDIVTFHRDKVYACHDGTIEKIVGTRTSIGGLCVYIKSYFYEGEGDFEGDRIFSMTAYAHLDEIWVKVGDRVKAGETVIGLEGNTGFVISGNTPYWGNAPAGVGTHLHLSWYEYLQGGIPRWKNCMQNSTDPLLAIMDENPNYTGINIFLENMNGYLRKIRRQLESLQRS